MAKAKVKTETAKRGPGRPPDNDREDGGASRSLGQVLAALRMRREWSRLEMFEELMKALTQLEPRYRNCLKVSPSEIKRQKTAGKPQPKRARTAEDEAERRDSIISKWEQGSSEPNHGVIKCYARTFGTNTIALYGAARLFVCLRNAANGKDEVERAAHLATAQRRVDGLKRMLAAYAKILEGFDDRGYARGLKGGTRTNVVPLLERRQAIINRLLDAYSHSDTDAEQKWDERFAMLFDDFAATNRV